MRIIFILILMIFSFNVSSHEGATGIIKERMDNFKSSQKKLKQIKNSLNKPDFETIQNLSKELENWGSEMVNFFPKDSMASVSNKSQASNDIWNNFDQFKQLAYNFEKASNNLHQISKNKDSQNLKEAFYKLAGTCSACHKSFKN